MSKLQEIKQDVAILSLSIKLDAEKPQLVDAKTFVDDMKWLIEQLEQAQEKINRLQSTVDARFLSINKGDEEQRWLMQEDNIRLTEVNQQLIEALEWYADKDTYGITDTVELDELTSKAREALASVKQE